MKSLILTYIFLTIWFYDISLLSVRLTDSRRSSNFPRNDFE